MSLHEPSDPASVDDLSGFEPDFGLDRDGHGAETATLVVRVRGAGAISLAPHRLEVHGATLKRHAQTCNGVARLSGLPPGRYRVELVSERLVVARRVWLGVGEVVMDFRLAQPVCPTAVIREPADDKTMQWSRPFRAAG